MRCVEPRSASGRSSQSPLRPLTERGRSGKFSIFPEVYIFPPPRALLWECARPCVFRKDLRLQQKRGGVLWKILSC